MIIEYNKNTETEQKMAKMFQEQFARACKFFDASEEQSFGDITTVKFVYIGRSAGTIAHSVNETISRNMFKHVSIVFTFNVALFERCDSDDEFIDVFIHELAHMFVARYYGIDCKAHGKEFRAIARMLGGSGSTRHTFNTAGLRVRAVKRHSLTCQCGADIVLTAMKYNKVMTEKNIWRCNKCRSTAHHWTYNGVAVLK